MVVEIATILLGAAAAVALVLYAAPRGLFGHPKKAASVVATRPATTYTPKAQTAPVATVEEAPVKAEPAPAPEPTPAPSSAPAIYETVQPETTPAPPAPAAVGTSAVTFGASPVSPRPSRTYRRRAVPSGTSVGRTVRHRERKR